MESFGSSVFSGTGITGGTECVWSSIHDVAQSAGIW